MHVRHSLRGAAAIVFFSSLLLASCRRGGRAASVETGQQASLAGMRYVRNIPNTYARMFSVDEYEGGYRLITVDGTMRYLLVPEHSSVPEALPPDITVLRQPLDSIYLASSPVMALMCRIGALSRIQRAGDENHNRFSIYSNKHKVNAIQSSADCTNQPQRSPESPAKSTFAMR